MRLVAEKIIVFKDLRDWKFEGNGPCKATDISTSFELQKILNRLQGLELEGFHVRAV